MTAAVDPGWGQAVAKLPTALLPTRGMRMAVGSTDGLTVMRVLWLAFTAAMVLLGVVVALIDAFVPGGGVDGRIVVAAVLGFGVLAQLVATRVAGEVAGATPAAVRASAQRVFFVRVALAEPAGLLGFLGFVLSGNVAVYVAGAAVAMVGLVAVAPTRSWIERGQGRLADRGSDVDLLAALVGGGITR